MKVGVLNGFVNEIEELASACEIRECTALASKYKGK